jgi:lipoprotein NlpI
MSWAGRKSDRNDLVDANKSAEQARTLAPNAPLVYRLLTNIHLCQKDYGNALQDIDAYLKLDPGSELGARAKQLRQRIAQKIAAPNSPPPGETKP